MNILDPRFRYVNAASTDLRKTFARLKREARVAQGSTVPEKPRAPVVTLRRSGTGGGA
jgi:hypothetical protein